VETATNKDNTISKFIELHCSHISQNMVWNPDLKWNWM